MISNRKSNRDSTSCSPITIASIAIIIPRVQNAIRYARLPRVTLKFVFIRSPPFRPSHIEDSSLAGYAVKDTRIVDRHILFRDDFDDLLCHHPTR